jgi:hypothetical protein
MQEAEMAVINVPLTYGADISRRRKRRLELQDACRYLGFGMLEIQEDGLSNVTMAGKVELPRNWAFAVDKIANLIEKERPSVIFVPHDRDFNATHIGAHELIFDSLRLQDSSVGCHVVEWEYWAPMERPNLLVEVAKDYLVDLITALSFHVDEMKRNPLHVTLPAWMQDNVRRGSELVAGQGHCAPDFEFGTIYRLRRWERSRISDPLKKGRFVGSKNSLSDLFR